MVNEVQSDASRALEGRGKSGREHGTARDARPRDAMLRRADRVCAGIASAR
jgi:hypothetical protein